MGIAGRVSRKDAKACKDAEARTPGQLQDTGSGLQFCDTHRSARITEFAGPSPDAHLETVSVTEVVCCKLPLVPVIVNVDVPLPFPAVTVIVVLPEVLTEVGLKLAVAPPDNPLTVNPTVPLNPPVGVTVTV